MLTRIWKMNEGKNRKKVNKLITAYAGRFSHSCTRDWYIKIMSLFLKCVLVRGSDTIWSLIYFIFENDPPFGICSLWVIFPLYPLVDCRPLTIDPAPDPLVFQRHIGLFKSVPVLAAWSLKPWQKWVEVCYHRICYTDITIITVDLSLFINISMRR